MKKALLLSALVFSTVCIASAQNIVGDWQGTLRAGSTEVHVLLHIVNAGMPASKPLWTSLSRGPTVSP